MQRVEIGNSVNTQDYSFRIDDELLLPVLQRGLDNTGRTPGPIVSASSDEPHTIAVSLNTPPAAGGDLYSHVRHAELKRAGHKG